MLIQVSKELTSAAVLCVFVVAPVYADVDSCMLGKWKPEEGQLQKQFGQLSQQQIKAVTGQVILSFNKSGTGIYHMDNLTLSMKPPASGGPPMEITMVMNGKSDFNWSAGNKKFTMTNYNMKLKTSGFMKMGDQKIPLPSMPIKNDQAASGIADGSYTCSGNKLTFDAGNKDSILKKWQRI